MSDHIVPQFATRLHDAYLPAAEKAATWCHRRRTCKPYNYGNTI